MDLESDETRSAGELRWAQALADEVRALVAEIAAEEEVEEEAPAGMAAVLEVSALARHRRARTRRHEAVMAEPFFGVLFDVVGEHHLIGLHTVADPHGDVVVVDWRTAIGETFFQATHDDPRGVVVRRRIRIVEGAVVGVDDEWLLPAVEPPRTLVGDGALFSDIERGGTSMRPVVATLHRAQDEAIRAGTRGVTVVHGGPGTGKTVVALNRASFVDHRARRSPLETWPCLFLVPSSGLAAYVEEVLPALSSDSVVIETTGRFMDRLAAAVVGPRADDLVEALGSLDRASLGSGQARQAWRRAQRTSMTTSPAVLRSGDGLISVRRDELEGLVAGMAHRSHAAVRASMRRSLVAAVRDPDVPRSAVLRSASELVDQILPRPALDAVVADLNGQAPPPGGVVGPSHDATIAAALIMLAIEIDGAGAAREAVWADDKNDETIALEHEEPFEWSGNTVHEDIASGLRGSEAFVERTTALWARGPMPHPLRFGHVLVDEVQDVSPEALRVLSTLYGAGGRTLVGDLAQSGPNVWYSSFDALARTMRRKGERTAYHQLRLNYRNDREIVELVRAIGRAIDGSIDIEAVRTSPGVVDIRRYDPGTPGALEDEVASASGVGGPLIWVGACGPGPDGPGLTARDAKGLEFGAATIVVAPAVERSVATWRELYVAVSRAGSRCRVIVPWQPASSDNGAVPQEWRSL